MRPTLQILVPQQMLKEILVNQPVDMKFQDFMRKIIAAGLHDFKEELKEEKRIKQKERRELKRVK